MPPVLSVVDYDAWKKGYMPPSNHILIHKLSHEGAKVVISTPVSREHQMWIVIEGPPLTRAARKMLREVIKIWFDDEDSESKETLAPVGDQPNPGTSAGEA